MLLSQLLIPRCFSSSSFWFLCYVFEPQDFPNSFSRHGSITQCSLSMASSLSCSCNPICPTPNTITQPPDLNVSQKPQRHLSLTLVKVPAGYQDTRIPGYHVHNTRSICHAHHTSRDTHKTFQHASGFQLCSSVS